MKVQGNLKNLNKLLTAYNKEFEQNIESLQKSYFSDLVKYQEDLLLKICSEYKLNYTELHEKYIKNFRKSLKKSKSFQLIEDVDIDSDLNEIQSNLDEVDENMILEKIEIDGKTYYCDKNEGTILNNEAEKVGTYNEGKFILHKN